MKVLICGAGPTGLLLSNYLMQRPDYQVHIVERLPDPRGLNLRSYPVQLQSRALSALEDVPGLNVQGIWAAGACFHQEKRDQKIPLDPPKLFVDHDKLTLTLLENLMNTETAKGSSISIDFDCTLQDMDLEKKTISVVDKGNKAQKSRMLSFDRLVAADGCRSKIRNHLHQIGQLKAEQKEIPDEFRKIELLQNSQDGSLQLDPELIHGWMLQDGKIRVLAATTGENCMNGVFVYEKGDDPFENFKSPEDVEAYFDELSSTSLAKLVSKEEATRLLERPASSLVTVKCDRLHIQDSVLLMGDAGHASSQSVGHGCISALQDVQVFGRLLDEHQDDWQQALPAFTRTRLDDAHALFEMSDYAVPSGKLMKVEWILRQLFRKILPSKIGNLMRPLPVDLLSDTTLDYHEVLEKSSWWIDRVKASKLKEQN